MGTVDRQVVDRVVALLREAKSVLFITGAGLSADSGLPTYRGVGGLYEDQSTEDGLPIEVALSGEVFASRPEVTWKYIQRIERSCRNARPNRGHEVMALCEKRVARAWVFTQNVDGFHRAAGSRNLVELHGDVHRLRCTGCAWTGRVESYEGLPAVPRCDRCGGVVRPDVVLFGELLPTGAIQTLQRESAAGFDLVFAVGTTAAFPYVVAPVLEAHWRGVPTVEVNPGTSSVSHLVTHRLAARAADALDALWQAW